MEREGVRDFDVSCSNYSTEKLLLYVRRARIPQMWRKGACICANSAEPAAFTGKSDGNFR